MDMRDVETFAFARAMDRSGGLAAIDDLQPAKSRNLQSVRRGLGGDLVHSNGNAVVVRHEVVRLVAPRIAAAAADFAGRLQNRTDIIFTETGPDILVTPTEHRAREDGK